MGGIILAMGKMRACDAVGCGCDNG